MGVRTALVPAAVTDLVEWCSQYLCVPLTCACHARAHVGVVARVAQAAVVHAGAMAFVRVGARAREYVRVDNDAVLTAQRCLHA